MAKVILTSKSSAMKSYLPFLSLALVFTSCTSAYKSGQTPDDVYFSPARPHEEYVRTEKDDDRQYRGDEAYREDRYLRMKVHNRMWSTIDDGYYYSYAPMPPYIYTSSYNYGYSAPIYWNYLYNPYCCCNTKVANYKSPVYSKPRMVNLRVFDNLPITTNPKAATYSTKVYSTPKSSNNSGSGGSGAGAILRNVFFGGSEGRSSGGSSSSSGSYNTKTYSSSGSSSGSSSSSSGSSGSSNSSRGNATRGRN
jgi:hypothetical protein